VERFGTSKAHDKGTDQATEAARAGVEGRIRTLLIDADRTIPGRLDRSTGRIELSSADSPDPDDLLDELGELVLSKGGEVLVVPSGDMPSQTDWRPSTPTEDDRQMRPGFQETRT
jgi:hypothetical protein